MTQPTGPRGLMVIDAGIIAHPLWDPLEVLTSIAHVARVGGEVAVIACPPHEQYLAPGEGTGWIRRGPGDATPWDTVQRLGWRGLLAVLPTAAYDGRPSDLVERALRFAERHHVQSVAFAASSALRYPPTRGGRPVVSMSPWLPDAPAEILAPALAESLYQARVSCGLEPA